MLPRAESVSLRESLNFHVTNDPDASEHL